MRLAYALFVVFLLSNIPSPLYPLWQTQMSFTASTTTVLFAVYQIGVLCGLLALARFAERRGSRWSLAATLGIAAAAAVLFAVATEPWHLGLARFLSGIASGIVVSYGAATLTAHYAARGKVNGHWVAALSITAGLALGPVMGGAFIDLVANPGVSVFVVEGILLLGAGVGVALIRPAAPAPPLFRPAAPAKSVRGRSLISSGGPRPPQLSLALAVFTTCGIVCSIHMSVGSVYLASELGIHTGLAAGGMVSTVFAAGFLIQFALTRSSLRAKSYWGMALGVAGAAVLGYGILAASVPAVFASAVLSGASQGASQLAAMSIAREYLWEHDLTTGFVRLNVFGYSAGAATVLVTGALVPAMGLSGAITLICALALVITTGTLIFFTVRRGLLKPVQPAVPEASGIAVR
jgi:MFS family permease